MSIKGKLTGAKEKVKGTYGRVRTLRSERGGIVEPVIETNDGVESNLLPDYILNQLPNGKLPEEETYQPYHLSPELYHRQKRLPL